MMGPFPGVSDSSGLRWGPIVCISNNFSGDTEAFGPGTIFWEPLALIINGIHQHSPNRPNRKFGQDARKQMRDTLMLRKNAESFALITSKHLHLLHGLPQSLSRTALLH